MDNIRRVRGGIPPRMSFPSSPTYETFTRNHLIVVCSSSDLLVSSDKAQSPIAQYIILGPSPYNLLCKFIVSKKKNIANSLINSTIYFIPTSKFGPICPKICQYTLIYYAFHMAWILHFHSARIFNN